MIYEDLLRRFTEMSKQILGENLVGIYLHGSSAMGCFNPQKSDLDLILVVYDNITDCVKIEFLNNLPVLNKEAPAKGIELSIVKREYCDPFVYPTPYELHFSPDYINWIERDINDYVNKLKGTDRDLGAHFTIINHYGKVLYGEPIAKVFGEVPKNNYIDSIWFDIENACDETLRNPMYMTLNLCRVLAYMQNDLVLSKKTGGDWGLQSLPLKYHAIIGKALECYQSDEEMMIDSQSALDFASYMITQIKGAFL